MKFRINAAGQLNKQAVRMAIHRPCGGAEDSQNSDMCTPSISAFPQALSFDSQNLYGTTGVSLIRALQMYPRLYPLNVLDSADIPSCLEGHFARVQYKTTQLRCREFSMQTQHRSAARRQRASPHRCCLELKPASLRQHQTQHHPMTMWALVRPFPCFRVLIGQASM